MVRSIPGDARRVRPPTALVPTHPTQGRDPARDAVRTAPLHRGLPTLVDPPVGEHAIPQCRISVRLPPDGIVAPARAIATTALHQQPLHPGPRRGAFVPGLLPLCIRPGHILLGHRVRVSRDGGEKIPGALHPLGHALLILADDGDDADVVESCRCHWLPDLAKGLLNIGHHRQHRRHTRRHRCYLPAPNATQRDPSHHHPRRVPGHPLGCESLQHLQHVPPNDHGLEIHRTTPGVGQDEPGLLVPEVPVGRDHQATVPDLPATQRTL
mmetsp:Transcript_90376/g.206656  ORF Transcript_90376/g.206656 Transcript_90376/m.206656 type:complete len:268 (+) Transcript_90376:1797-2600(+)